MAGLPGLYPPQRTECPQRVPAQDGGELTWEVEPAFREGRVSVCERRNSLAVIVFRRTDKERTHIHKRLLAGLDLETRAELTLTGTYAQATVDVRCASHSPAPQHRQALEGDPRRQSQRGAHPRPLLTRGRPSARAGSGRRPPGYGPPHAPPPGPPQAAASRERARAGSRSSTSSRYRHVPDRVPQIHRHPCAADRLPLRSDWRPPSPR